MKIQQRIGVCILAEPSYALSKKKKRRKKANRREQKAHKNITYSGSKESM